MLRSFHMTTVGQAGLVLNKHVNAGPGTFPLIMTACIGASDDDLLNLAAETH